MTDTNLGSISDKGKSIVPPAGLLAGTGVVAGLGAVIASSCCVLPIALAGIGVTGAALSILEFLVGIRSFLLAGAGLALLSGWGLFLLRKKTIICDADGTCSSSARAKRVAAPLGLGTMLVGLALLWGPYIEPFLLKLIR